MSERGRERAPIRECIMFVIIPWRDMTTANNRRCNVSHRMGRISSFADMDGLVDRSWFAICSGNAEKVSLIKSANARILNQQIK